MNMITIRKNSDTNHIYFRAFPITRYQGSKRRLLPWIYDHLRGLRFNTVLDLFGGTGVVSYLFKKMGKKVTYNDYLEFNYIIGLALIENTKVRLSPDDIEFLLKEHPKVKYPRLVGKTFRGIYFTDSENHWLDIIITNIDMLKKAYKGKALKYKRAIAFYALFESALIKRPFNLFHRKNLYLRTAKLKRERTFGNKLTWDRRFKTYFNRFVQEMNDSTFSNNKKNLSLNYDALELPRKKYDLVYIDPPYLSHQKSSLNNDYHRLYHFLEGMVNYRRWQQNIDFATANCRLLDKPNDWRNKKEARGLYDKLFKEHQGSILVVSCKLQGIPSSAALKRLMLKYKDKVHVYQKKHSYALYKQNGNPKENKEALLIGI